MIEHTYPSLEAFYAADRRRALSREQDVGLMWRGARQDSYRAAWVQDTGELYLLRHGEPAAGGGTVWLVARRFARHELLASLANYPKVCGRPDSLSWLLDRTATPAAAAA